MLISGEILGLFSFFKDVVSSFQLDQADLDQCYNDLSLDTWSLIFGEILGLFSFLEDVVTVLQKK